MATFKELGDKLESKLLTIGNFKIGKTGQTLEERYNNGYAEDYTHGEVIGSSKDKSTVDEFEMYLIDRFGDLPNCDNEQVGGGEMTDSEEYIVYLMYNMD